MAEKWKKSFSNEGEWKPGFALVDVIISVGKSDNGLVAVHQFSLFMLGSRYK